MLFKIKVFIHQWRRRFYALFFRKYSSTKLSAAEAKEYGVLLFEHSSQLIRQYAGVDPVAQKNKSTSIERALRSLNGLLLQPGENFSFWKLVGKPSLRRGFLPGLELRGKEYIQTPGGGLCQITNMFHWAVLNLGLSVIERHRHQYDLFPDDGRSVPFGSGATVFYNYIDFRFQNCSGIPLFFSFKIEDEKLKLSVFSKQPLPYSVIVGEADHAFYEKDGVRYRRNSIVSKKTDPASGMQRHCDRIDNDCRVLY